MCDNIKYDPIVFKIDNQHDLKLIHDFQEQHMNSCREAFPDTLGALFTYKIIPTSLGPLYYVECACGEEIALDGDFNFHVSSRLCILPALSDREFAI